MNRFFCMRCTKPADDGIDWPWPLDKARITRIRLCCACAAVMLRRVAVKCGENIKMKGATNDKRKAKTL